MIVLDGAVEMEQKSPSFRSSPGTPTHFYDMLLHGAAASKWTVSPIKPGALFFLSSVSIILPSTPDKRYYEFNH